MSKISSRFTPIKDEDPECDRTEVTIAIYNIDPELITNKLGIVPTRSQKIGKPRIMPSSVERMGKVNSWLLSSEDSYISSKDIRTHLDWVLDKLEPARTQLHEIQQLPEVKMVLRCPWWSKHGGGGPTLWPEQMERMARLNLECSFEFAYYEDDDESTEQ